MGFAALNPSYNRVPKRRDKPGDDDGLMLVITPTAFIQKFIDSK
jgi:hypothetical protein